jgi:uncharacterized membrane protein (DUF485 family)
MAAPVTLRTGYGRTRRVKMSNIRLILNVLWCTFALVILSLYFVYLVECLKNDDWLNATVAGLFTAGLIAAAYGMAKLGGKTWKK